MFHSIFTFFPLLASGDTIFLVFFFLLFPVIIAIVIFVAIMAYKAEKKRTEDLADIAKTLKLKFHPQETHSLPETLSDFPLFSRGHSKRAYNLMQDTIDDMNIKIFDYTYTTGSGKNRSTYLHTVFLYTCSKFDLPTFTLCQETFFHKIGTAFGFRDINFNTHPEFSRRYLLKGQDEDKIRRVFQPKILDYYEQSKRYLSTEGMGDRIVFYHTDVAREKPEEIPQVLTETLKISQMFKTK